MRKPVDVGNSLVAASFLPGGAWLCLSGYHPRHGTVELSGMPPFDEAWRGDPRAVRRYRSWMVEERHAFLRLWTRDVTRHDVAADTIAREPTVEQRHSLVAASGRTAQLTLIVRGHLDRPPLAEITEVSPLAPTGAVTVLSPEGTRLRLDAAALPAAATVNVAVRGGEPGRWNLVDAAGAKLEIRWSGRLELVVRCTLDARESRPARPARHATRPELWPERLWVGRRQLHAAARHRGALARIRAGALRYVRQCAALRVAPREVCFLADHRVLPLSWTRDAYYQALLLLSSGDRAATDLVEEHLRWLFGRCRREQGAWQRSHLPNGQAKDKAFQADQQLYPLLELADYRVVTGSLPEDPGGDDGGARHWGGLVAEVWYSLPISDDGLVVTEENPADDRSQFPFLLSSQILAWYVATRLAELEEELDLGALALGNAARRLRESVASFFLRQGPYGTQWAYEIDRGGGGRLYADANDLPTALAPLWGFCPADDAAWRRTMRFAFSEQNGAYAPGRFGGLGSLHTPGTWPLGDVQEWIAASLCGDGDRAEAALDRLVTVSADDGLLPEAYDPDTGEWRARHWFAWPAAVLGALTPVPESVGNPLQPGRAGDTSKYRFARHFERRERRGSIPDFKHHGIEIRM